AEKKTKRKMRRFFFLFPLITALVGVNKEHASSALAAGGRLFRKWGKARGGACFVVQAGWAGIARWRISGVPCCDMLVVAAAAVGDVHKVVGGIYGDGVGLASRRKGRSDHRHQRMSTAIEEEQAHGIRRDVRGKYVPAAPIHRDAPWRRRHV